MMALWNSILHLLGSCLAINISLNTLLKLAKCDKYFSNQLKPTHTMSVAIKNCNCLTALICPVMA